MTADMMMLPSANQDLSLLAQHIWQRPSLSYRPPAGDDTAGWCDSWRVLWGAGDALAGLLFQEGCRSATSASQLAGSLYIYEHGIFHVRCRNTECLHLKITGSYSAASGLRALTGSCKAIVQFFGALT